MDGHLDELVRCRRNRRRKGRLDRLESAKPFRFFLLCRRSRDPRWGLRRLWALVLIAHRSIAVQQSSVMHDAGPVRQYCVRDKSRDCPVALRAADRSATLERRGSRLTFTCQRSRSLSTIPIFTLGIGSSPLEYDVVRHAHDATHARLGCNRASVSCRSRRLSFDVLMNPSSEEPDAVHPVRVRRSGG